MGRGRGVMEYICGRLGGGNDVVGRWEIAFEMLMFWRAPAEWMGVMF